MIYLSANNLKGLETILEPFKRLVKTIKILTGIIFKICMFNEKFIYIQKKINKIQNNPYKIVKI